MRQPELSSRALECISCPGVRRPFLYPEQGIHQDRRQSLCKETPALWSYTLQNPRHHLAPLVGAQRPEPRADLPTPVPSPQRSQNPV